ncbi:bacteriohemerythrin [Magnetospirillum sp. UT-4]|uniref:bacteriohemerythrin n=1 Tax=Magnetospirillum sp. UT-4 TaxID=2681467 RepID=UPI001380440E|nr:bacteriohemerythrin [Magnetospirillum sp. UT-4]CAA7611561.1 Methyl-accepting chemotaxis protein [Magnetospirillum sp. UT-4]
MALLAWTDELSVGVSVLDADHREIVDLINTLHEAVENHRGAQVLGQAMASLRRHVQEHFAREEDLLRRTGYPGFDEHADQHGTTAEKLGELERMLGTDERAARAVLDFLKAWFINHVVGNDLKMREFFREKGVADVAGHHRRRGLLSILARRTDVLRLKTRIMLLVAVPLLVILGMAAISLADSAARVGRQTAILDLARLGTVSSALIHEMQKERGASALFLGSKGTQFGPELGDQRQATDTRLAAFRTAATAALPKLAPDIARQVTVALADLDGLGGTREGVTALSMPPPQAIKFYTGAIANQIAAVEALVHMADEPETVREMAAYTAIINAKERAGQERAVGSAGFAAGQFAPALHRRLVELWAEQSAFFHSFRRLAAPPLIAGLLKLQQSEAEKGVAQWRDVAIASPFTGTTGDIKAPEWFKATTVRIDQMKALEDEAAAALIAGAERRLGELSRTLWGLAAFLGLVVAAVVVGAMVIVAGIVPPLLALTGCTNRLAEGDRTVDVPGQGARDELGDMARAVQFFKEKLIASELTGAEGWVESQARVEAMLRKEQAITAFDARMSAFVAEVSDGSGRLLDSAGVMTEVVSETMSRSGVVADAAHDAAGRVQSAAAATEQLTASIREIARQVHAQAGATREAVEHAQRTNGLVEGMLSSAARIGEVVKLIQGIAAQTNLLALNATIEAARAGEAGRGFAVVANEVKNLANQTSKATEEIVEQIGGIQRVTQDSANAIRLVVSRIDGINEISSAVAAAVEEQEAATAEISRNVQDTAQGTDSVTANIADVLHAAERADHAAQMVAASAESLGGHAGRLREEVQQFLAAVKA